MIMKRLQHMQMWEEHKERQYEWGDGEEWLERDYRIFIDLV